MTDEERWEACGKPEIICHDDGYGGGCYYAGPNNENRVCEVCGEDEPDEETTRCPACGARFCWIPKCPVCGKRCAWTDDVIKPIEYEMIMKKEDMHGSDKS